MLASASCLWAIAAVPPALARFDISHQQARTATSPEQLLEHGVMLYRDNRPREALQVWQQALVAYRDLGDRLGEGKILGNLGIAYRALGQYAQAIEHYQQALTINQASNATYQERRTLGNLGNVYAIIGQYDRALEYQLSSLALARELQDPAGERIALANLGATYADQGNYRTATDYYQESLTLSQALGEQGEEAFILCNLGSAYNIWEKDHALAVDYYQQCLALSQHIGDRFLEAEAFSGLGFSHEGLADFEQAMAYYEQGLAIFSAMDDAQALAVTLNNRAHTLVAWSKLAGTHHRTDLLATAEQDLFQAVAALDSLRTNLSEDANRISLFETQVATYNLLQQVLIAQEKTHEALVASEEGRSRAFATLLADNALSTEPETQPSSNFDLQQIQQFAQHNNATLVEYSLVPDDDFIHQGNSRGMAETLYIWVVSPEGRVDFKSVDLKEKGIVLSDDIQQSLSAIGVRSRSRGFAPASSVEVNHTEQLQKLHEVLIDPIADFLPADPDMPVIFVPQGELFLVPFAALADAEGTYLIEKHTLLTAPSIQVLQLAQSSYVAPRPLVDVPGDDFLIVGNPAMPEVWDAKSNQMLMLQTLPGAEIEAKAVAELFGGNPLLNQQATEQRVRQQLAEATVIHLATHGLLEYGQPEDSGVRDAPGAIALTPDDKYDGLLTTAEISTLSLTADLVVLSACDTGLGQLTGDGVIGLSRSLLGAGASNVVVSLWAVPDAPTATLMTAFYEQLRQGTSKAQALRAAMIVTMENHPEPSEWAAFTLIGQTD